MTQLCWKPKGINRLLERSVQVYRLLQSKKILQKTLGLCGGF
jgi:hypothetical protein